MSTGKVAAVSSVNLGKRNVCGDRRPTALPGFCDTAPKTRTGTSGRSRAVVRRAHRHSRVLGLKN